jgi:hypothetical protein
MHHAVQARNLCAGKLQISPLAKIEACSHSKEEANRNILFYGKSCALKYSEGIWIVKNHVFHCYNNPKN